MFSCGCDSAADKTVQNGSSGGAGQPRAVVAEGLIDDTGSDGADLFNLPAGDPEITVNVTPWSDIVSATKGSGKVVVLDVWSLGCEPCMQEFPGLVALQGEFKDGIQCVSANIDFDGRKTHPPENYLTEVNNFLQFTKAKTVNHICATPSDEVYSALDIDSIPAVLVFDAEGNEVKRFVDAGETRGFTYEKDVAPFVRELLQPTEGLSAEGSDPSGQ
jgi:thiol-disulfide isomerase/thioredoxin